MLLSIALHCYLAVIFFRSPSYKPQKANFVSNRFVVEIARSRGTSSSTNENVKIHELNSKNVSAERLNTAVSNSAQSEQPVAESIQNNKKEKNIEPQNSFVAAQQENGSSYGSTTPLVLTPPLSLVLTWPKNLADEVSVVVLATLNQQAIELVVKSSSGSVIIDEYAVNYIREYTSQEKFQSWPQELSVVLRK